MKKTLAVLLLFVMCSSVVIAANPEAGQQNKSVETGRNRTTETPAKDISVTAQQKSHVMAKNTNQLREMIQNRQQEMNQETEVMGEQLRAIYQNQNRVRLAVHTLLAAENISGGIGKNISAIAREFNNSVKATIKSEEKINSRGGFTKFLFGGDSEAADEIEQELNMNQERIQELNRLTEHCDEELKGMMQEQIQNMEQEQNRLRQKSQEEKRNKGLFGWLFR